MTTAYNVTWLHNLNVVKEAKQWMKRNLISQEQFASIGKEYSSGFYHPNLMIRILLFIATLIGLTGITGLLTLIVMDSGEDIIALMSFVYGVGSFFILDRFFIAKNHHYKSGVTEALLYHSMGFTIGGIAGLSDANLHIVLISCLIVSTFTAFRYIDLVSTAIAIGSFAWLIFYEMYEAGGLLQQITPFAFIILFSPLYFLFKRAKARIETDHWVNCLILAEALCLLLVYAAGNYLVVRELSVSLMNLYLSPGEDIPFAFLFYCLTVLIPIVYLYAGIKNKDVVMLRVSLAVLAFSVFTFKYYYSTGHPEITLTVAGAILLLISISLYKYLKTPRNGFTTEDILGDRLSNLNIEAFIVSQTLGGNQSEGDDGAKFGGGSFGGGGSGGGF